MKFDPVTKEAVGFTDPLIHVMNKNICCEISKDSINKRRNCIVLGDMVDDCTMIEDMDLDVVLKVGYLNTNEVERLPRFLDVYDIVVTNDESFEWLYKLLKLIKLCLDVV